MVSFVESTLRVTHKKYGDQPSAFIDDDQDFDTFFCAIIKQLRDINTLDKDPSLFLHSYLKVKPNCKILISKYFFPTLAALDTQIEFIHRIQTYKEQLNELYIQLELGNSPFPDTIPLFSITHLKLLPYIVEFIPIVSKTARILTSFQTVSHTKSDPQLSYVAENNHIPVPIFSQLRRIFISIHSTLKI